MHQHENWLQLTGGTGRRCDAQASGQDIAAIRDMFFTKNTSRLWSLAKALKVSEGVVHKCVDRQGRGGLAKLPMEKIGPSVNAFALKQFGAESGNRIEKDRLLLIRHVLLPGLNPFQNEIHSLLLNYPIYKPFLSFVLVGNVTRFYHCPTVLAVKAQQCTISFIRCLTFRWTWETKRRSPSLEHHLKVY